MLTIYVRNWDTGCVTLLATQIRVQITCFLDQAGHFICVFIGAAHQFNQHLEQETDFKSLLSGIRIKTFIFSNLQYDGYVEK